MSGWGYGPDNGPHKWGETFPICNGAQQSPIDIVHKEAQHDRSLKGLKVKFNPADAKDLINTGYQFQVTFVDDGDTTTLSGGPITGTYRLKQFHFHWGAGNDRGSEHTVNGIKFPCELHLVYWNPKYPSFADAVKQCDGLAVVGVFLKIGGANPSLQKVLDGLDTIKCKGQQTNFANFNTATLLPESLEYWTYDGSLTTPPTLECVKWIVLKDAISVSPAQMDVFRKVLFSAEGEEACCMVDNYRPPQPLKGRKVRASFTSMSS